MPYPQRNVTCFQRNCSDCGIISPSNAGACRDLCDETQLLELTAAKNCRSSSTETNSINRSFSQPFSDRPARRFKSSFTLTVTVCGEAVGWVKRARPRFGGAARRSLECSNHSRAVRGARAAPPELESAPLDPPYGLSACPPHKP